MSQIRFSTTTHRVLAGWDRPLQQCFLVVDDGLDTVYYSNLADRRLPRGDMTPALVLARLTDLGVPTPPTLEAVLRAHVDENAGNVAVLLGTYTGATWIVPNEH